MKKAEYFQFVQRHNMTRLTLAEARAIRGRRIVWYRYCRYTMSAREFTVGGCIDLMTEAGRLPDEEYPSLADRWMETMEIEELRQKSLTLRLLDADGTATPLVTEIRPASGEIAFVDEATGKPVWFMPVADRHVSRHRTEPADTSDLLIWMRRQIQLGNYIAFSNHGIWHDTGLSWIPPRQPEGGVSNVIRLFGGLRMDGMVPPPLYHAEWKKFVDPIEYDGIVGLHDDDGHSMQVAWIR